MGERSFDRDATISADGITVYQLYTESEFELPAVVLKLVSDRSERTVVRLELPNRYPGRIGFHPEFEGDGWTVTEDRLSFETELDPDASVTTLYLVEGADEELGERALEECEIAAVTSLEFPEDDPEPVEDHPTEGGQSEALAGDEPAATPLGTDPDELLVDPDELAAESAGDGLLDAIGDGDRAGEGDEEASEPARDVSSFSTDELVSELRARLEAGELSADQRRRLGDELRSDDTATDARIEHLQSRVSDVEAFTASMETLFDRHGPPADAFDEFQQRLEAMEGEVEELQTGVEPRLDTVERELEDVSGDVTAVEADVDELESDVTALQDWRKKLTGALQTFTDG